MCLITISCMFFVCQHPKHSPTHPSSALTSPSLCSSISTMLFFSLSCAQEDMCNMVKYHNTGTPPGTPTWYLHLVPQPGTPTWYLHLVPQPGTSTWYPNLVPPPGTPTWYLHLVPQPGTSTWYPNLVPPPGTPTWYLHLEPQPGTSTWYPNLVLEGVCSNIDEERGHHGYGYQFSGPKDIVYGQTHTTLYIGTHTSHCT